MLSFRNHIFDIYDKNDFVLNNLQYLIYYKTQQSKQAGFSKFFMNHKIYSTLEILSQSENEEVEWEL